MRKYELLQQAMFAKAGEEFAPVTLPHTWNNLDGQDGGNDFHRGVCHYEIALPSPTPGKRQYIEFRGANHIATVSCNGTELGRHEGGFSTFRFELTQAMQPENNILSVAVTNEVCHVYPQRADFTFFGGIYRDVYFVEVEDAHFDLLKHGSDAVFMTAYSGGFTRADLFPVNAEGCQVQLEILNQEDEVVFDTTVDAAAHTYITTTLENIHLWQGLEDPYCYRARASLLKNGTLLDQVAVTYGYRSFRADAQYGFFLNGKSMPLRGVCRHQDRENMGWAITKKEHDEDMALIQEIGANTIRLAHYQHDQYFYDLCDKAGMVIWAEIPYISMHMPGKAAYDNTMSQMTELIAQNYNHPSILFWGIANEITIYNISEEQYQNLCDLHILAKRLDPHRLTTMAQLSRLPITDQQIQITDIQSYNIYHGWYTGTVADNAPWIDKFHATHPDRTLGISEYGVEILLQWHSATPINHDYTEEYGCLYHQEMLKVFEARPWLWATHLWNMFDFAADLRNEGGVKGRNNKGLVSYDRKIKKDPFFVYQAYWSKKPMVHISGRRFTDRAPGERDITVYTNCDTVTLLVNGKEYATMEAVDHAVVFPEVPLALGENTLTAVSGDVSDTITLNGVQIHNEAYDLPDLAAALQAGNWFFEQDDKEDYGENGYHSRLPMGILLGNQRCFELVRGWVMSKQSLDLSFRFKFVSSMTQYRDNENYNGKQLRDMITINTYMKEDDLAVLDKLLRSVKYK